MKHLDELSIRIQHFKFWMLRFDFKIVYIPWKNLVITDALSKAPLMAPDQHDKHLKENVQAYVDVIFQDFLATKLRFEEIRHAQENDPLCQEMARHCREGWPEKGQIKGLVKQYYPVLSKISIVERLIIPSAMQRLVLDQIHTGHQGISKC